MPRHLVIVESPAKARTLGRYLGSDYVVRASLGHVRDLPRGELGIDVVRGFTPAYEVLPARRRVLAELAAAAREAETIFLAADPDREGEAICWHLAQSLAGPHRFRRVAFHEITRRAVEAAFGEPREVDPRRVDAQQARRILDRLVGYNLSPLLWQKIAGGLSAGRVQSVALRIVCERERAIRAFAPEERWVVRARLAAGEPPPFLATLATEAAQPARPGNAGEAKRLADALGSARFRVASVIERRRRRPPAPPFTTSTLQQEAFRRLRFGVKKTMQLAQRLYEGVELGGEGAVGLITYMRTDTTRVAPEAAAAAREHVARVFGPEYVPATPNEFPSARGAQGAHEAIRPTDLARSPEALGGRLGREELALYTLVLERFLASQMAAADYDDTLVEVAADPPGPPPGPPAFGLRARGSTLRFRGFLALHEESADEEAPRDGTTPLPPLRAGQELALVGVESEQKFSAPPPRFSEASLVKELERCGVGRPSTYAGILATLLDRHYVEKAKGRLAPTPLGFSVTDLLVARFPDLLSVGYTAGMEEGLDAIEEGRATLIGTLAEFWRRFSAALEAARREPATARPAPTPRAVAGAGKPAAAGVACPLCHEGRVVPRRSAREGRSFFGCSRFPACRFTSTHPPLAESCPECGEACLYEKDTRRDGRVAFCGNPACHYHRSV